MAEIDFFGEGNQQNDNSNAAAAPNATNNPMAAPDLNGEKNGAEDINNNPTAAPQNNEPPIYGQQQEKEDDNTQSSSTGELEPGSNIEFDGNTYTVANNGDIIDSNGNVFKKANEVKEWLDSLNVEDEDNEELSIDSIQNAIGLNLTDKNGNPIEYTNNAEGVKAYVNDVINQSIDDIQQSTINRFYADNPLVKEFMDYVAVTGSPVGFGELPDRSGITIDKDDENQQAVIIAMAAKEFGNPSVNENYIKYLKDSGALYDEALGCLKALQEKDAQQKQDYEEQAAQQEYERQQQLDQYWNDVANIIDSGNLDGLQIPEAFVKEIGGEKYTFTKEDFFDYLSRSDTDENGVTMTDYERDLQEMTYEENLNKYLLDAWLMFTGGTYKDLADMAMKDNQVKTLKLKAKQQASNGTVRITRPASKGKIDDIIFN